MAMTLRKADQRGAADFGWLKSAHSFSFGNYYDPSNMGFGVLRVINEDRVAPGAGFPNHGHQNMDILSYVVEGALEHKDSMGTSSVINAGDLQRMSAGTGVMHSEYNASKTDPVHFLQIWIIPQTTGAKPSYEQKHFPLEERAGQLKLLGSPDGRDGSITIDQDVSIYGTIVEHKDALTVPVRADRGIWLQVVKGSVDANGERLTAGDGLAVLDVNALDLSNGDAAELLIFDLPRP